MLPAILIAAAGLANGEVCPAEIHTQQSGKDVPTGWQATVDFRRHALSGVRFFHGSPEKANDIYPRPIKANHYSYDFFATYRERWVACSYSFTSVEMRKQLPASLKRCRVVREPHRDVLESVTCE